MPLAALGRKLCSANLGGSVSGSRRAPCSSAIELHGQYRGIRRRASDEVNCSLLTLGYSALFAEALRYCSVVSLGRGNSEEIGSEFSGDYFRNFRTERSIDAA